MSSDGGPPQAGSILEYGPAEPAAGWLDFGVLARRRRARFLRLLKSQWPAAGGLDFGVWARRRRARFLRCVKSLWPAAGGLEFGVLLT